MAQRTVEPASVAAGAAARAEKSPYEQLIKALVDAGARRLAETDGPNRPGTGSGSVLEFWNTPDPRPGRLVIVQRWTDGETGRRGCWDAYVQISEHKTAEAIGRVLGKMEGPAVVEVLRELVRNNYGQPAGVTVPALDPARELLRTLGAEA